MATYTDCSFEKATIVLDGNAYERCIFRECKVVITRGNFTLKNSSFDACSFEFAGEAANIKDLVLGLINQKSNLAARA